MFPYYLVAALIGAYPASSVIIDGVGSGLWYLLALFGLICAAINVTCKLHFTCEPEVRLLGLILLAFLAYTLINQITHGIDDFSESRLERQALLLLTFPIYVLIAKLRLDQEAIFKSIIISGLIFLVYFLVSPTTSRLDGVVHAIHFGNIAMITGLLCIPTTLNGHSLLWRLLAIVAVTGALISFIYAGSRGGVVALSIALFCGLLLHAFRSKLFGRFALGTIALSAIIIVSIKTVEPLNNRYTATVIELKATEEGHFNNSIGIRFQLWEQAWSAAQQNFLTGGGFHAYRQEMLNAISSGELGSFYGHFLSEPHNQILFQLSSTGIIGVGLLFLLFFAPVVLILKKSNFHPNAYEICIILSITALFFCGLTITLLNQRKIIQIFGLLYILAAWSLQSRNSQDQLTIP